MRYFAFLLPLLISHTLYAQLSLDSCIAQAYRHYQFDLEAADITSSGDLSVKNAGNTWYPNLYFDYASTYQNQQIEFPSAPGQQNALAIPLDFHRALINFSQNIYDGSVAAQRKKLEKVNTEGRQYELSAQKIKLRSYIVQLYMGLLLVEENQAIVKGKKEVIESQLKKLNAAVENGLAFSSDQMIMKAEYHTLKQMETDLKSRRSSMLAQLSVQLGIDIDENTKLEKPQIVELSPEIFEQRPDILLIRNQIKLMDSKKKLTSSSRMPTVRLFGSAGMGSPGYNIIDNSWQPMGLIGIGLRWNIWDWKAASNEKKILTIQQQNLEYSLNRQKLKLYSDLKQQEEEIKRLELVMKEDELIISLRKEVLAIKSAQLENGIITSSDYINELNHRSTAELNRSIHALELLQAKINYNIISGN